MHKWIILGAIMAGVVLVPSANATSTALPGCAVGEPLAGQLQMIGWESKVESVYTIVWTQDSRSGPILQTDVVQPVLQTVDGPEVTDNLYNAIPGATYVVTVYGPDGAAPRLATCSITAT